MEKLTLTQSDIQNSANGDASHLSFKDIEVTIVELLLKLNDRLDKKAEEEQYFSDHKCFQTALYEYKTSEFMKAAKWFRRAAMKGHTKSQFYLGIMFTQGKGVPKSLYHGYSWLSLAASQSCPEATAAMERVERYMTSSEISQANKLAATRYEEIHDLNFCYLKSK
ncbi:tetratricopeptide repeat protein [Algicola sagamiensis]|uniref:tetratricopeptide repeat protein n=1 Tax=Algicola sagamiensis TaxID=163869 RepID=UPI0003801FB7|nr:SEL1-like repeat protein [Algicola sagamiensis]